MIFSKITKKYFPFPLYEKRKVMYDILDYIGVVFLFPGKAGEFAMACLKCGKNTTDEQSFCARCLEVMEDYPVKPDVHIQLPTRPTVPDTKKSPRKRRSLSAEEKLPILRRRLRKLVALVVTLAILLGAAVFLLLQDYFTESESEFGRNYTFGYPFD